jgi:hypothetical protein
MNSFSCEFDKNLHSEVTRPQNPISAATAVMIRQLPRTSKLATEEEILHIYVDVHDEVLQMMADEIVRKLAHTLIKSSTLQC